MGVLICSATDVLLERHPSSLLGPGKVDQPEGYEGINLHKLEVRLRSNDRVLQSILSRSSERLAVRERQSPPTPPQTQFAAETASLATTPPAPTAPACIPPLAATPQQPRVGEPCRRTDGGQSSALNAAGCMGTSDGTSSTEAFAASRRMRNNVEAMLGTAPRLPRPLADGMVVGAAKGTARWLAMDDRTWYQAKKFMDDFMADCPSERILKRRKMTPDQWEESKVAAIEGKNLHKLEVQPCRRTDGGQSSALNDGTSSTEAFAASGRMRNNMEAMLGTPSRLPRPLADGMIVGAAKETARWLAVDDRTWHQAKKFMDDCMADCPSERILNRRKMTPGQWEESKVAAIEAAIRADPSLATSRHINRSAFPMDGWTPLHTAAARGNLKFVKALLKVPGVSVWSVDLQGRTALALAAEGGHLELCLLLKERMEAESADTIVGINAPIDLAGMTPLAWSVRSRTRNKQVESHLYATGDASVCPATPAALRSGGAKTVKGGGTARTGAGRAAAQSVGEGLPCGYSEAPGWRIVMEDSVCTHNPIPLDPEAREAPTADPTSMFGIFDGHGGAFTSRYVAGALVGCLQATPGWKSGDRDLPKLCPAILEAFVGCDALLAKKPRMVVTERENPSDGKRFEARDGSGSTAVVVFVTPLHVIVANAGDSRAVLIMANSGAGGKGGGRIASEEGKIETASVATSADGAGRCDSIRLVEVSAMSRDHTAKDDRERERVTAAGGKAVEVKYRNEDGTESMVVRTAYDGKVEGQSVMPTRGFGDLSYKQRKDADGNLLPPGEQVVTVCPEVMVHERGSSGTEELLLLACDGIWDVFTSQDAGEFLLSSLEGPLDQANGEDLARACDALVAECLRRGSTDNMPAMAVSLGSGPPLRSAIGGRMLFGDGQ
ncbi:unnamed protein product [Ascophyllum nodosum]